MTTDERIAELEAENARLKAGLLTADRIKYEGACAERDAARKARDEDRGCAIALERRALAAESRIRGLEEALEGAAKSLAWIAARHREHNETRDDVMSEVREYANSRSACAWAALPRP